MLFSSRNMVTEMRTPYSYSRSMFTGDRENPRARGNKTKQSQINNLGSTSPRHGYRNYFDDDSDDENEQQPSIKDSTRHSVSTRSSISIKDTVKSTSASMAAASEAHMSEYEHWRVHNISPGGGCESSCSNGKETVAAFGDVVTEVFDLINEVAFPEVIDLANNAEAKETQPPLNSVSYKEDDDSVFVRSAAYDKSKKAKDFLGFIGAVKSGNKHVILTPTAPSALLVPNGIPLNLLSESSSIVVTETTEEDEEEEKADKAKKVDDKGNDDRRDDNDIDCVADEDSSIEDFGSKTLRSRNSERKIPDRYSSLDGSYSSDDSSDGDVNQKNVDWNSTESKKSTDKDYENYIMDVVNNEKNKQNAIKPSTGDKERRNPILPFTLEGAALIKSAIAGSLKRVKPKYSKPSSAGGADKPELLTIVESSDEEGYTSEEEKANEEEVTPLEELETSNKVEIIPEAEVVEESKTENNPEFSGEMKSTDDQPIKADKTIGSCEEDYSSSTVSGSSYTSSDDDRTYLSYTGSDDDDSFLELECESGTSHTRYSLGIEDESVTYSIGAKDSLLDESISQQSNSTKSNESSYHGSTLRRTLSDESSVDNSEVNAVERKTSVAESLLAEDEEEESKANEERSSQPSIIKSSQFCSVYDNLYPSDSLFSFPTQDETLFDFSNSNIEQEKLEPPPSILADGSMEQSPSVLTDKSTGEEDNDGNEPNGNKVLDVIKHDTDGVQQHEKREEEIQDTQGQEGAQEQKAETETIVDVKHDHEDNNNSNRHSDVDSEERDGVEDTKAVEEGVFEAKAGVNEDISRISDWSVSVAYDNPEQSSDAPKRSRILPSRRMNKITQPNTSPKTNSEDGHGKNIAIDEDSNSNRSSGTAESIETVDSSNKKTAADIKSSANSTNPIRTGKRRNLSRVRMFNQHRQNILKLKHKAE